MKGQRGDTKKLTDPTTKGQEIWKSGIKPEKNVILWYKDCYKVLLGLVMGKKLKIRGRIQINKSICYNKNIYVILIVFKCVCSVL